MGRSKSVPVHRIVSNLSPLSLPWLVILIQMLSPVTPIRKDASLQNNRICRTSVQGRYLLCDDNGHVCDAFSVDPNSRCCPFNQEQFSCQGCNLLLQCCNTYEFCVSCCLNPVRTPKEMVANMKIAKHETAGTYSSVFDFCVGRCRHNSESVVHENAYLSDFHHCFSISSNSSGVTDTQMETRLIGLKIITGRQGESCDSACKSNGQSCVPNKLALLNQCEVMKKYFSCKGSCLASVGADQPAEVVDDAPSHLNPGACLYTEKQSILSCDGFHQHTRRLCPCA
ncbi:OLC1v1018673C2 [Oldenlandia corymbosa var. corymbosa]|uniref:SREBP regulating gene protein n=1 Tax=Oldenlandia corymbosa var. corymbosa TaxID=529605 RepID=A0AAV1EC79_OLDCO|nr:OLC1v1018673C2 [Oldenlandia corymbosa var. corymbosa]